MQGKVLFSDERSGRMMDETKGLGSCSACTGGACTGAKKKGPHSAALSECRAKEDQSSNNLRVTVPWSKVSTTK